MPSLLSRNMLLIAKREYLEQIRGRAFRLSTILVPLLVIFLLGVSAVTGRKMAQATAHRDRRRQSRAGRRYPHQPRRRKNAPATPSISLRPSPRRIAPISRRASRTNPSTVLLVIENSSTDTPSVTYISQSSGDLMSTSRLEDAIDHGFLNLRLAQQGVPPHQIASLAEPVSH